LEFAKEIATAKIFKRNFARLSDEYNKDLLDFAQLPTGRARRSKQVELDADLKALQEAEKSMHADRELVYGEG
jgi:hypothetical protein